ncbi:MAG TPA: ABC transporter permease, partial [Thermoanaerobaculia bacterium]|nr:ABC transporter permease [Thermoanaerobaculia bacterium]
MTLAKALLYFAREALVNLRRSWKVSFLAVFTIAVSLFIAGCFLIINENLGSIVAGWRKQAKVIVYLSKDGGAADTQKLEREIAARPFVDSVEVVTQGEAAARFRRIFPALGDVLEEAGGGTLPASVEVHVDPALAQGAEFADWLSSLKARPGVAMVDDDRDWISELKAVLAVLRGMGLVLGGVLVAAAVFTIASVIRLTAYLHRDEIAVMRLVGATEFFIRGPFYAEGFIEGILGGCLALAGLAAGSLALAKGSGAAL